MQPFSRKKLKLCQIMQAINLTLCLILLMLLPKIEIILFFILCTVMEGLLLIMIALRNKTVLRQYIHRLIYSDFKYYF